MTQRAWARSLAGAAAALIATWAGPAAASAFQLVEQNASGLGNAYAGQAAAAEDASTIFYNPAGMTLLRKRQLVAGLGLLRPMGEFRNGGTVANPGAPEFQPTLGGDGGDPFDLAAVPHLYASVEALPGFLWAGVGVNVPFGLKTDWDPDWMGRFHAVESEVQTINVNPSIALKVLPWLSLGGGVNWQWITATLSNSVNYSAAAFGAGAAAAVPALAATCTGATAAGGCEGLATVKGDDRSWGWNVGAMLDFPATGTRVGASYRSKIKHELEGNVSFGNRPALLAAGVPDGAIRAEIELPDTASVAVSQELFRKLQLLADFTWTGWSSLQDLSIYRASGAGLTSTPLEFEDSWRVGLGANYRVAETFKVRGGVAYDRTPVQDADRTPRLPDEDRIWVAGGAQWEVFENFALDAGVAYIFVSEASSNLPSVDPSPPAGFTPPPRGGLVGNYQGNVLVGSAQARFSF